MSTYLARSRKGALDLSVNFIVKLILALVVFGFGLMVLRSIMSTAGSGELTREIDEQMQSQIQTLMDTGDRIVIFPEEQTIEMGNSGTFALGILNVLDEPVPIDFITEVQCFEFIGNDGQTRECGAYTEQWTFEDYPVETLSNNEEATVGVGVRPTGDGQVGRYMYAVNVDYERNGQRENYGMVIFSVNVVT